MIQLGEPLNRKKTIKCPSCGDRILYVLHDRKAGDRLRWQDVRFLQASKTTVMNTLYCSKCDSPWINKSTGRLIKFTKKIFSVNEIDRVIQKKIDKYKKSRKDQNAFAEMLKMASKRDSNQTIFVGKKSNAPSAFKYFKPMIKDCKDSKIKPSELIGGKAKKEKIYKPITGPGIPEMLKAEKVNKTAVRNAALEIIENCKPLTKKQIKESNDALNKLHEKGKKLSDVVTGLDGFCTIGKKRGA